MEHEGSGFAMNGESTAMFTKGGCRLDRRKMQKGAFGHWIGLITMETIRQKIADLLP